jgi:hypothetical protein
MMGPTESLEEYGQRLRSTTRGTLKADPTAKLDITGYWEILKWFETAEGHAFWVAQSTVILDRSDGSSDGTNPDGSPRAATLAVSGWPVDQRMRWIERLALRQGLTKRTAREVAKIAAAAEGNLAAYLLGTVRDLQP